MGNKNTEAVRKSREKHQIVQIRINFPLEEKQKIYAYADKKGISVSAYIKRLIAEDMAKG